MNTCSFTDFMETRKPWLTSDFIRKAYLDDNGNFRLLYADGGGKVYRIDDCTRAQLKDVVLLLQKNGISVEKLEKVE